MIKKFGKNVNLIEKTLEEKGHLKIFLDYFRQKEIEHIMKILKNQKNKMMK